MKVNTRECLLVWIRRCWWNHSAELPFFSNATPITMAAVCRRFQGISKFSSWEVKSLIPWFRMLSTTELKTIILSNENGAPGCLLGIFRGWNTKQQLCGDYFINRCFWIPSLNNQYFTERIPWFLLWLKWCKWKESSTWTHNCNWD